MLAAALTLSALLSFALAMVNRRLSGRWSYPPAVFCLTWAVLLGGLAMAGDFFVPLHVSTAAAFLTGCLSFSAGGLVTVVYTNLMGRHDVRDEREFQASPGMGRVLDCTIVLLVLTLPLFYQRLVTLSRAVNISDFWIALRTQIAFGTEQGPSLTLGVFARIMAVATFLSFIATAEIDRSFASKRRAVLLILIATGLHTATMARLGALITLFGSAGIFLLKYRRFPPRAILVTALTAVAVFAIPAVLLGKGGSTNSGMSENVSGVAGSIALYTMGGSVALDQAVAQGVRRPFDVPAIIRWPAEKVGILEPAQPAPPFEAYINIPMPINVYTIYYQCYTSYGFPGVAMAMFVVGLVCTWIYTVALHGSSPATALFGVVFANVLVSNAADGFFNGLSYNLQAVAAVLILYRLARTIDARIKARERQLDFGGAPEVIPGV